jgi:hypothetical protein
MSFLTPLMLFGALAAAIPVGIHLFFRSRYRTVPWAAMKFLLTSVEQTSRRLKFQEYMLLLVRMFLLTLLAVAFMRPLNLTILSSAWILLAAGLFCVTATWWLQAWSTPELGRNITRLLIGYGVLFFLWLVLGVSYPFMSAGATSVVRGKGDAVDAVFVFDLSYSMGASDGDGKTRLNRAKEEALKIIEELPAHSSVQIVTCAGNDKAILGPHSPGNLDQARSIVEGLDITHLGTDLYRGVAFAEGVMDRGQASNKELYIFSDMQKMGFDQHSGELKKTLQDVKEKASIYLVRCGTRPVKNVAIVDIKPQSGVPRPGERVGFAVLVRNSGAEAIEGLKVSLMVDGDEKAVEETAVPKIKPSETHAVTLTAKLEKPGLRVLTAKVMSDDLDADNQFDQVVLVRDRVNILVVDGNFNEREPEKASSYHLMHSLLPVQETERAKYKYNPRVVPARLASPALLQNQDVCILVNCSVQPKLGLRADTLPPDFVEAVAGFVRKGHGLVIFSGDNVQPDAYNKILGRKYGLLPLPLKGVIKAPGNLPYFINRDSFAHAPATYWNFKDDKYYEVFDAVPVWQHIDVDETASAKKPVKKDDDAPEEKETGKAKDENQPQVIVRLNSEKPLAVTRKVDAGEVIFIGTAAQQEGADNNIPNWTIFNKLPPYVYFLNATVAHLMHGQTQTYNLVAGQTLTWYPTEKFDHVYSLVHPDGKTIERLKPPERQRIDDRLVVTKPDLTRAGIYRIFAHPKGLEGGESIDLTAALKASVPIAVIPDLDESLDLTQLTDRQLDESLGFTPIHITAGEPQGVSMGSDRQNREWTTLVLLAVLGLVVFEIAAAWWCGRGW